MVGETCLLFLGSIGVRPKEGSLATIFSELVLHTISGTNVGAMWDSCLDSFGVTKAYNKQGLFLHLFRSRVWTMFEPTLKKNKTKQKHVGIKLERFESRARLLLIYKIQ